MYVIGFITEMEDFEIEVEELRGLSGVDKEKYPLKWIKWETQFKSPNGTRAPIWRELEGDIGYVIASTHDAGVVVILCKNNGNCCPIKGYVVDKSGSESLDYTATGGDVANLKEALSALSPIFKEKIAEAQQEQEEEPQSR